MGKIVLLLLRVAVGGVFLYAGIPKALDMQEFFRAILNYPLVSWDVAIVIAAFLPWFEIVCASALIFHRLYLGATIALGGMAIVFIAAIASAWARGLDISCGCFGHSNAPSNYPLHIAGNVCLLIAIIVLLIAESRQLRKVASETVQL